ncbi:MAG: Uma2 family endonuclease [Spirosomaceae bacterium]|nr:Uma2 family endonuclease [Spirosomataceae bacterium]
MQHVLSIPEKLGRYTDDELFELCAANPDLRIERNANYELIFLPFDGFTTSTYNAELTFKIGVWNRKSKEGFVTNSNGGYILPNGAMRAPDVAWINREKISRIPKEKQKKFLPACPDFVIELRSESDNLSELKAKMEEWIENGTKLGWLIDPKKKQTHVYQPNQKNIIENFATDLTGKNVLEGFSVNLIKLFEMDAAETDGEEN